MIIPVLFLLVILSFVMERCKQNRMKSYKFDTIKKFIPLDKYSFSTKKLTTEDGWKIQLVNLRHKKNYNSNLEPVLIQHGYGTSSASWLCTGEDTSPAMILVRKGYDVYLSNSRGTVYSLEHEKLKVSQKEFWDITFQDLKYDIKANVQYIAELTQKKIHYIGLSQGSSSMVAALADPDQEVASFIKPHILKFYCFAPVVYLKGSSHFETKYSSCFFPCFKCLLGMFGIYSMSANPENIPDWKIKFRRKFNCLYSCGAYSNTDKSNAFNNTSVAGIYKLFFPYGCSVVGAEHFMQLYNLPGKKYFKKFDYGPVKNMQKYGSAKPPAYELNKVDIPVDIYYGDKDKHIVPANMKMLLGDLQNPKAKLIEKKGWGHLTFHVGTEMEEFYGSLLDSEENKA